MISSGVGLAHDEVVVSDAPVASSMFGYRFGDRMPLVPGAPQAPGRPARRGWRVVGRHRVRLHHPTRSAAVAVQADQYWRAIRVKAGVPSLRFHDLRHTALSPSRYT